MLEIAIVEDNDQEAKMLSECLNRYAQEHQRSFSIRRYGDGDAFLADERAVFDLVFMDVEMPLVNGLRTAEKLRGRKAAGKGQPGDARVCHEAVPVRGQRL